MLNRIFAVFVAGEHIFYDHTECVIFILFSEDTEVFKVKKSSHSKRIAKQLKKEKKERDEKLEKEQQEKIREARLRGESIESDDEETRERNLKVGLL